MTADTDDRPCGPSPSHGSTGQSSKHVVASAPWLRQPVNDVDQQECRESPAHETHDAPKVHGELQTHVPSEATQGTPFVVPDICCPVVEDVGITATSHSSGIERTVQQEYHSVMLRDESPMPGPRVTFLQAGQPSAKGKEQAADKQPPSSAERCFDETWLERAMKRMECRLQATIHSSLEPIL